jgi:hypothetical protein
MPRKHLTLAGVLVGVALIVVAAFQYPGGSQHDAHSTGFDLKYNYLSDLFTKTAGNSEASTSRYFAVPGMLVLALSFAVFFYRFGQKQPTASMRRLIAFSGMGSMGFAFLVVTPLHDAMITLASALSLLTLLGIVVSLYKSRRFAMLGYGVLGMLTAYFANYVYYSRQHLELLPTLQKVTFVLIVSWFLMLEYTTRQQ